MNTKNLIIASLLGAIITAVFSVIPVLNLLNCLVCLPFWGGPFLAAWYYKRQTGVLLMNHAILIGMVTGIFAGVFSFIGMAGGLGLASQVRQVLPTGILPAELWANDPSLLFTFTSVVFNIVFGVIGGAIAGAVLNKKKSANWSLNKNT